MIKNIVVFICLLGGITGIACEKMPRPPTGPDPVPPPATSRVVFMTIPVINIQPNAHGSYPAATNGLGAGTVEVIVKAITDTGAHAIYVFKLPKLNTPEYTEMFQTMSVCRSNSSRREEACAAAIASNLSADRNKSVSFSQTQEEVAPAQSAASGISYQTVIWNRETQMAVSVEGEYAYTPQPR